MNYDQYLPENIKEMLPSTWHSDDDLTSSLGKTGYVPPDASLLVDAVTALAMGKNVLLKGPTGSGKTKSGEALLYIFHQPMFSVNGSVDFDAESLLGFRSLTYKADRQEIEFVPGAIINAMNKGIFLYVDEINMSM